MVTLLALLFTPKAFALSCDEIVQMLEQNVPAKFVVQTIEDSGTAFTKEDVRCLTNADAPAEIVTAVRSTMAKSAAPTEGDAGSDDSPKEDKRSDYDKEEALGAREDGGGGKSKAKSRELEDRDGGDDGEGGGDSDPEKLAAAIKAYNAKKPLTSSLKLLDLLKDNTYPEKGARSCTTWDARSTTSGCTTRRSTTSPRS